MFSISVMISKTVLWNFLNPYDLKLIVGEPGGFPHSSGIR